MKRMVNEKKKNYMFLTPVHEINPTLNKNSWDIKNLLEKVHEFSMKYELREQIGQVIFFPILYSILATRFFLKKQ